MKRLLLASILMILSFFICFFENDFLNRSISTLTTYINQAEADFSNNNDEYIYHSNKALNYWQNREFWLTIFINDEQIENITSKLITLNNSYISSDFFNSAEQLKLMLKNLKNSEVLNVY